MAIVDDDGVPQAARSPIQVLDRSVALLTVISAAGAGGIALKDLNAAVGLRPSTGRTLLSALITHGLVRQAEGTRHYLLGPTFFDLNRSYLAQSDLASVAAPILRGLWERTNETVHLSVLKDARRTDLSVLVSPQLLNINPTTARFRTGAAVPPYRTAAGKVLFAGRSRQERAAMLAQELWQDVAGATPLSAVEIQALADEVVAQGWATNLEEEAPGVCGVAAPVIDDGGATVAAMCVGYPSVRHTVAYSDALRAAVVASARELSGLLGASRPARP